MVDQVLLTLLMDIAELKQRWFDECSQNNLCFLLLKCEFGVLQSASSFSKGKHVSLTL